MLSRVLKSGRISRPSLISSLLMILPFFAQVMKSRSSI